MSTLVGSGNLEDSITIEISEEDANIGSASLGHGKNQTRPGRGAGAGTRILQINEMRQFRRHHHIEIPIAIHVGDGRILWGRRVGTFGEGDVGPAVRVRATEGNTYMAFSVRNVVRIKRTGVIFAI